MRAAELRLLAIGLLLALSACQLAATAPPEPTAADREAATVKPVRDPNHRSSTPGTAMGGQVTPSPGWSAQAPPPLKLTILYDNYVYDPQLATGHGFAALVERGDLTLLFDTGADGPTLLSNMGLMNVDPVDIEAVVLSHIHGDHVGGLDGLLAAGSRPVVYLLPSFPAEFKVHVQGLTRVVEVAPGMSIAEGAFTTGEIEGAVPEQALVLDTDRGLVIVTGCAHPGVVEIVRHTNQLSSRPVYLLMGGFHLRNRSPEEIASIISSLEGLGVEHVAPCHCTGDRAIGQFRREFGEDFIEAGVGRELQVGN